MAVESVDRKDQQNYKEAYTERENQLQTRHKRELEHMQRKHAKAVAELRQEHDKAMTGIRESSRDIMTEKEQRHIREIQEIQDVNRKRTAKLKMDEEDRYQAMKENLQDQVEGANEKRQNERTRLLTNFEEQTGEHNRQDREMELRTREGSQEALRNQSKRLNDKMEAEREHYRGYIQTKNEQSDRDMTSLKRNRDSQVGELNRKLQKEKHDNETKFATVLKGDREQYSAALEHMHHAYDTSLKEEKAKYGELSEKLNEDFDNNWNELRNKNDDRMQNEVKKLRMENYQLKNPVRSEAQQVRYEQELAKKNLTDGFAKNIEEMEARRLASNAANQKLHARQIQEVQTKHDRAVQDLNTKHGNRLLDQKLKDEAYFDREIGKVTNDSKLSKLQLERQKKHLHEYFKDRTMEQADYYDEALFLKQRDFNERVNEQRATLEKKRSEDVSAMRNRAEKENINHQEKLIDTITNYERQLATVKNDYEKRLRKQAEMFREQTARQVKHMQMDREANESKLQSRMNLLKEAHEREVEMLRKRQETERQEMALKKS